MPLDPIPASTQSDGRHKIAYVSSGNPLSVAVLKGATTKNMTYSFTDGGFKHEVDQATVVDSRYTLPTDLSRPGRTTESLSVKYVDSEDPDSAAAILEEGTSGFFVIRRGKDNAADWAVGDKVKVITFTAGVPIDDEPVGNGVDTISQKMSITNITKRKATLVA